MADIHMTKAEMMVGFAQGRTLIQEEWAHPQEIAWVDELVAEGKAVAGPWEYRDGFQCERRKIVAAARPRHEGERG